MGQKYLYEIVESTDLELPLAVYDSATQVAKYLGITRNGVYARIHSQSKGHKTGILSGTKVYRVDYEEDLNFDE